ncbi:cytochrome b/b6 domain-containing protein [Denitratisoma oestradiolicum]|uniref:Cytochrome b561 bacterial/Ni-hydrogenase domain-containing protein n=1 Tax=Denitratisoma oestradiolicum TaxID=311182 RepID=A0A6S6XUB1_9PROT|nr:cytochrome b/b6 domain-containing protein [Denitratisoma oestradiolicum]TWO80624.1 hypothetical protein CBW56_09310 [Denitratisoma oestradiolicum]CAB1367703.1 conserved membrane protein of unknown function [Denitratisoma oestradiolicum]
MSLFQENKERRSRQEPLVKVWDRVVRLGHWLLVISFFVIYLRSRKFPIHAYAGYLMTLLLLLRIVWGFFGSKAARFRSFLFGPREMIAYTRDTLSGHARYYASHNPLGAAMVFTLLPLLLANCLIGLLIYSSGQQLGPFGSLVPSDWEDVLIPVHHVLGDGLAVLALVHIIGTLWAGWLHRENYILAMMTGLKRVPRDSHEALAGNPVATPWQPWRRKAFTFLDHDHPFWGSLALLAVILLLLIYPVIDFLTWLNRYLVAY